MRQLNTMNPLQAVHANWYAESSKWCVLNTALLCLSSAIYGFCFTARAHFPCRSVRRESSSFLYEGPRFQRNQKISQRRMMKRSKVLPSLMKEIRIIWGMGFDITNLDSQHLFFWLLLIFFLISLTITSQNSCINCSVVCMHLKSLYNYTQVLCCVEQFVLCQTIRPFT